MHLTIQEPVIYQRFFSDDLPCKDPKDYYKYVTIWTALDVLSFYRPITPYLTLGLNVVRALPSFYKTFNEICRGQCNTSQMIKTAYYASIIGLTVINPVYGLLASNVDSTLIIGYKFYCHSLKKPMTKRQMADMSMTFLGQIAKVSLFFTSNPALIALSLAPRALFCTVNLVIKLTTVNKDPHRPNYIEVPLNLFLLATSYYRYNSAIHLISEMSNQDTVDTILNLDTMVRSNLSILTSGNRS